MVKISIYHVTKQNNKPIKQSKYTEKNIVAEYD